MRTSFPTCRRNRSVRTEAHALEARVLFSYAAQPRDLETLGNRVLISMNDLTVGRELWQTSGQPLDTTLVKDIRPGEEGSDPQKITSFGDVAYFSADDGVHGRELWKTDGTAAGTSLVADLTPGPQDSFITQLRMDGGVLYCVRSIVLPYGDFDDVLRIPAVPGDPVPEGAAPGTISRVEGGQAALDWLKTPKLGGHGYSTRDGRLYRADGPAGAGETLVYDSTADGQVGMFGGVFAAGDSRLFLLRSTAGPTVHLYVSDGTTAGTHPVAAAPGFDREPDISGATPILAAPDGRAYFGAVNFGGDQFHGGALWASDGSDAGTFPVAVFANVPRPFTFQDGKVYALEGYSLAVADAAARAGADLGQEGYDPQTLDFALLGGRFMYASTQHDDVRATFSSAEEPLPPSVHVQSSGMKDGEDGTLRASVLARSHNDSSYPFTITWDLDGDGAFDDATGAEVTLPGAELAARLTGDHLRFRARADDGRGAVAESRAGEVIVFPAAPTPTVEGVHTYAQGAEMELAITYTDASGLDLASLMGNDAAIQIGVPTQPGSPEHVVPARYVSIDSPIPGKTRTVTYRATLPAAPAQGTNLLVSVVLTTTGARDLNGNGYATTGPFSSIYVYALPEDLNNPPPGVPKNVSGKLVNVFTSDGQEGTTGLALRRVYADANRNGSFDAGEMSAVTDMDGTFALFAPPGAMLRAEMADGWVGADGGDGSVPINLRLNTPQVRLAPAAPVVVDVLVAYAGIESGPAFNDMAALRQRVRDTFVLANRPYGNSDTGVVLNLVGVLPVWYASSGIAKQDLAKLVKDGDGPLDEVHRERDRLGADVVVLIPADGDVPRRDHVLGIARQLAKPTGEPQAAFAFVTSAYDPNVLAHEVGHVLGAGHERAIMKRGVTPYAHGFVAPNNEFWDVMSYGTTGSPGLPFFSNPRMTYNGVPMGDAATADNARTVRESPRSSPPTASARPADPPARQRRWT